MSLENVKNEQGINGQGLADISREAEAPEKSGSNGSPFELLLQPQKDFEEDPVQINEKGERLPANVEKIQEMDQRIEKLSQLFNKMEGVRWILDGAMNISLERGEYIGYHKDNDVSVDKEDLAQLEEQLYENGYGLFLSERKPGTNDERKRVMRRVGHRYFDNPEGHMLIAPIDKEGRIPENQELNYIDVHLIKRNEKGEPITTSGAVMPEEWVKPQPLEYKGNRINLSHPARVIYYKLQTQNNAPADGKYKRGYDKTDVDRLLEAGVVSLQDIDELEKVYIDNENQVYRERVREIIERIARGITPNINSEQLFEIFMQDPEIAATAEWKKQVGDKEDLEIFNKKIKSLAEIIAGLKDKSAEAMVDKAMEVSKADLQEQAERKHKQIIEIRQKVQEAQDVRKLKQARERLNIIT
jgi:hypothetical protein